MTASERDERALVRDASRGDLGAVEELLARHLAGLEGFVRRRGVGLPRAKESASDIVQSVCREALVRMADERFVYRGEEPFKAWLYEAALLKLRARRRFWSAERRDPARERRAASGAGARSSAFPGAPCLADSGTPSMDAQRAEEREQARRLLADLPERYRRVIELVQLEGRPHEEAAAELGVSTGASRMLLARALARLAAAAGNADGLRGDSE